MYSFGRVVGDDRARLARGRRRNGLGGALQAQRGQTFALEIVLIALDLFLLAVHQVDVVAKEQVQVLVAVARQLLFDRVELE
jgi:hypothetical protein